MNINNFLLKDKNKALLIETKNGFSQDKLLNTIAQALNNGTKIIQFYDKKITDKENVELALKIRQLCSIFNALFIINSRADIAQTVKADGICLFENDISIQQAKNLFHDKTIIAKYIISHKNIIEAIENSVDYICIDSKNKELLNCNIDGLEKIKIIELDRQIL